jgi:hypothetical protein
MPDGRSPLPLRKAITSGKPFFSLLNQKSHHLQSDALQQPLTKYVKKRFASTHLKLQGPEA